MDGTVYMLAMEGSSNNYGKKQVQELGSARVVMMKLRSMAVIFLIVLPGIAT